MLTGTSGLELLLRSVRRLPTGSAPVRFQSGNSRDFAVNAGHGGTRSRGRSGVFCRDIPHCTDSRALLAMQKVEGSNPFSRFREGLHLQAFLLASPGSATASPDNDWTIVSAATRGRGRKVLFSRRFRATSTLEVLRPCRRSRVDRTG